MPKDIEYTEIGKDSISSKTFKQLEKTLLGKPLLEKIKPRIIEFYLENESLPYSFLEKYSDIVLVLLESIMSEIPRFEKTVTLIKGSRKQMPTDMNPGEIYYIEEYPALSFDDDLNLPYNYLILSSAKGLCINDGKIKIVDTEIQVHEKGKSSPAKNEAYIDQKLSDQGIVLSTSRLCNRIKSQLDSYYYHLAHYFFIEGSKDRKKFKMALKACLHLSSNEEPEDFNTRFKTVVTAAYLSDTSIMTVNDPIIFSVIKTSHQDAEAAFETLKLEKQKRNKKN